MEMSCSIFVKSYPQDYQWLGYCLKSIEKFCTGFHEIVVAIPRSHPLPLTKEKILLLDVPETYLSQQVTKLNADHHCEGDFILHVDSDCVFVKPTTPEDYIKNGKPDWWMADWDSINDGGKTKKAWFHVMAKCLQDCPQYEFMQRVDVCCPRDLYGEFRAFIERTHGIPMDAYVMNQPGHEFSEYNTLAQFCHTYHHDRFNWIDVSENKPEPSVRQYWSWGGLTPEIEKEINETLA